MTEKHIVLEDIDPVMLYGAGNSHLQVMNAIVLPSWMRHRSMRESCMAISLAKSNNAGVESSLISCSILLVFSYKGKKNNRHNQTLIPWNTEDYIKYLKNNQDTTTSLFDMESIANL